MKNTRNLMVIVIILVSFLLSNIVISADPAVDNIATDPESPAPLSTFTVIATITGENIISVNVTISECSDDTGLCYNPHNNIPMTLNADGKYETNITLEDDKDRTDHVQYAFVVNDNGTDYPLTDDNWKTYLDLDAGNGDQTNGDGKDNGSPGFELVIILLAVVVGIFLYRRKR